MKYTPASYEGEHVVLLPPGLTGTVDLADGTTVDLGPAGQNVIAVESHEQAMEVALAASQLALDDPTVPEVEIYDEEQSLANFAVEGYAPPTETTPASIDSQEA